MISPALQSRLDLQISEERPLVPLEAATFTRELYGQDHDDILNLIEVGALRWAFNIARDENGRRREVRIFWRCIKTYPLPQPEWRRGGSDADLIQVINEILPPLNGAHPTLATVRASQLARRFSTERMLPLYLLEAGELAPAKVARGRKESPLITRASIVEFLKRRRIS